MRIARDCRGQVEMVGDYRGLPAKDRDSRERVRMAGKGGGLWRTGGDYWEVQE